MKLRPIPRRLLVVGPVVLAVGLAVGALATSPAPAEGQRGVRAQVFLTQHRIPPNLSERGLLRFMRSHNARTLRESTEEDVRERKWVAQMAVAFNRPPGDLEFQVLFYDIHDGPRRFIESLPTYVNDPSMKTFVRAIVLPRPKFKPNRRMELVVTLRRQEVGRHRFAVEGERFRHSGQVDFTDEER